MSRSASGSSTSSVATTTSVTSASSEASTSSISRRVHGADQFTLLEELGSGSFGVVYKAIDK
jgi:hypothetical protein